MFVQPISKLKEHIFDNIKNTQHHKTLSVYYVIIRIDR